MKNANLKLICIAIILLLICLIPISVQATNEKVSIVKKDNQYIIYIDGYENKEFKFAFSNDKNADKELLAYANQRKDSNESNSNSIACIDSETQIDIAKDIYMWAKDGEQYILDGIKLDLTSAIQLEDMQSVEDTTKRISVDTTSTVERQEVIDGVTKKYTSGTVKITDDENSTYFYQRILLPSSSKYNKLMELAEEINASYSSMSMYNKVNKAIEFNNLFDELIQVAEWTKVENMTIEQPENSKDGDKYIVFLKKETNGQTDKVDAQFLTCKDNYIPEVKTEKVVTKTTAKLPITYDSVLLIVILGIIVLAIIIVYARMRKINKHQGKH